MTIDVWSATPNIIVQIDLQNSSLVDQLTILLEDTVDM